MKTKWFAAICILCVGAFSATEACSAPYTGSWGWGFGSTDPSGPFMTGYSDTGAYQENVYSGGGPIQTDTWQTLSYTIDKSVPASPTITVSVDGSPSTTSAYGTVITPVDFFLVLGGFTNPGLAPFGAPIYVRDLEVKLDGAPAALQDFSSYSVGADLLDGSYPEWTAPFIGGASLIVGSAPGGFKAATITDANEIPVWTFPALNVGDFNAADTVSFSVKAYWSSPPPPVPPTTLTPDKLVSVDFVITDGPPNYLTPASGDTTVGAGPNQNADGILFVGQPGPWNAFNIGGNNTNETSQGPSGSLLAADGGATTIQFSMEGAPTWRDNFVTSDAALRNDAAYLYATIGLTGDLINWHITGLDPLQTYSLVMFGTDPNNSSNTANGVLGVLDTDGDYNWLSITPNAQGEINGVFTYINIGSETTPGIQGFQLGWNPVPEPSSFALLGFAALGLVRFARRRRD